MKRFVFILSCAILGAVGLLAYIAMHFIDTAEDEKKRAQTAAARQARHAPKSDVQQEPLEGETKKEDDSKEQVS